MIGSCPTPEVFIRYFQACAERIGALQSLAPGPETDAAFSELVELVTKFFGNEADLARALFGDPFLRPSIEDLRGHSAAAESLLESHYSAIISNSSTFDESKDPLEVFPYVSNYRALVSLEVGLLRALDASPLEKLLFVGSGPLPLSSVFMSDQLKHSETFEVVNVDMDQTALAKGEQLVHAVSPTARMRFVHATASGLDPGLVGSMDVIWFAALVGRDLDDKLSVLDGLSSKMRVGGWLVVRSARSLRGVLYEPVQAREIVRACGGRLRLMMEAHPGNEVINSVLIFQRVV